LTASIVMAYSKGKPPKGKPRRQLKVPSKLMDNGLIPECKMSNSKLH